MRCSIKCSALAWMFTKGTEMIESVLRRSYLTLGKSQAMTSPHCACLTSEPPHESL